MFARRIKLNIDSNFEFDNEFGVGNEVRECLFGRHVCKKFPKTAQTSLSVIFLLDFIFPIVGKM